MVYGLVRGQTGLMVTLFVLVSCVICNNGSSEQKKKQLTLSFLFQINILVKISAGLLCN